jgi:hypothetical protein
MELALIPPFQLLCDTYLTSMQMLLPHLLSNSEYITYYIAHCTDSDNVVIMDNGAAEQKFFQEENLIEIASGLRVSELVAPDVMADATGTIAMSHAFIQRARYEGLEVPIGIVAQGKNLIDALRCAKELLATTSDIKTVYIPRLLLKNERPYIRLKLAERIKQYAPEVDIHFLGASTLWCGEILEAARSGLVRSLDTSLPYVYARQRLLLEFDSTPIKHRGGDDDFFTRIWNDDEVTVAKSNVQQVLNWSRGIC